MPRPATSMSMPSLYVAIAVLLSASTLDAVEIRRTIPARKTRMKPPATVAVSVTTKPPIEEVAEPHNLPIEEAAAPHNLLVNKDDVWRSVPATEVGDGELSDASLSHIKGEGDLMSWKISSPITFKYAVREVPDVLDVSNDALIFGHISDARDLARAKSRPLKRVVVVDEQVHANYGERIEAYFAHYDVTMKLLVLPTTEENKDIDMVLQIAEAIHELGVDRRLDPVIAIGGGVCMDIVGFAASIYRRRTPYVRVPTTLMGYVDASVGAKTGVNFSGKKNKLGAYIPPALTLLDRSFLATLDARQLANGAAEIAKMALVKDPELFELLASHGPELIDHKFQDLPPLPLQLPDALAIADAQEEYAAAAPARAKALARSQAPSRVLYLSIQTMLEELAPNLWEDSLERLVDFGHVFSMELEMAALFDEKLFHGEAVAIDMAFSSCLSHVRGHIDSSTLDAILGMMSGLQLPVYHPMMDAAMCDEALYERVKFSQGQKLPLPTAPGHARLFNDVTSEQVIEALAVWRARCAAE